MSKKALEGMKVLDLSHAMAGPFCTQRLGDMGADVIKVEAPTGDFARWMAMANAYVGDYTTNFLSLNRNKRSISLDLKKAEGLEIFYKLVKETDVVIQNFRPGVARRLKVDYETLSELNPGIIYLSISGYGEKGPLAHRPGQDLVVQGYSGGLYNVGKDEDPPFACGIFLVDTTTSHIATEGILAAYIHKMKTGEGQKVEVNLLQSILDIQVQEITTILNTGIVGKRTKEPMAHAFYGAPYGIYETKNGYMTIPMAHIHDLGNAINNDDLKEMKEWDDAVTHRDKISKILRDTLPNKTTEEWMEIFDTYNIWAGPVKKLEEILQDPQLEANEYIKTIYKEGLGELRLQDNPIKFSKTPTHMTPPPSLGEHSLQILEQLGYSEEQRILLLKEQIVIHKNTGRA